MLRIPLLALLGVVLLLCAGAAEASQCLEDSRKKALESADVAFFGRVITTERPDRDRENKVTLSVDKIYKGEPGPVVLVLVSGFKGGLPFERGKRYLVFADRDEEGQLWVYDCSGTVEETYAAEALALVNNPPATEPGMPVPASSAPAPSASSTPAPSARPSAEPASAASSAPPVDASPPPPPPTQAGGCGSCAMGASPEVGSPRSSVRAWSSLRWRAIREGGGFGRACDSSSGRRRSRARRSRGCHRCPTPPPG